VTTGELTVLGCYHPSQQNTFTGKLTTAMIDDVVGRAASLVADKR
jgi:uracil-DNA glycosylase